MALPLYYQQWLRLREISGRLTAMVATPATYRGTARGRPVRRTTGIRRDK